MHRAGKICVTKLLGLAFQLVEPRSFKPLAGIYQINNELFQQVESVALRGDFLASAAVFTLRGVGGPASAFFSARAAFFSRLAMRSALGSCSLNCSGD